MRREPLLNDSKKFREEGSAFIHMEVKDGKPRRDICAGDKKVVLAIACAIIAQVTGKDIGDITAAVNSL